MKLSMPKEVDFIINKLYANGFEAFMVGGCVRDSLLGKKPNDYDITTNALPDEIISIFEHTVPTGIKHGTITVIIDKEPFEVTTYRIDGEYINNRKPKEVKFVTNIKEDLSRRDFTINAMAYNHKCGLIDYFNGQVDLSNKTIKCVGEADKRFIEDALRMLRAIRFSSQLGFKIDSKTLDSIKKNSFLIKNISNERIIAELNKIFLSNNAATGIKLLYENNILENIFTLSKPNLKFDVLDKVSNNLSVRLSLFIHIIRTSNYLKLLKSLKYDNATINDVDTLLKNLNYTINLNSRKEVKLLLNKVSYNLIFNLLNLQLVLNIISKEYKQKLETTIIDIVSAKEPLQVKDLAINGTILINEFNIKAGKEIGLILNYLLDKVLDNPDLNNKDDLKNLIKSSRR